MPAYVTFPVAQIISELRSSVMDKLHMGGTYLQQAPKVTIGGLQVAIRQGGLGNLGASLGGALGALGGLSGLVALAGQISALQQLANLPQLAQLKALTDQLQGLGDELGGLADIGQNLLNIKDLSSALTDAVNAIGDVAKLPESLQSTIDELGGIESLKEQFSKISEFSGNLESLNTLANQVYSASNTSVTGASSFLQNPISSSIESMKSARAEVQASYLSILSKVDSAASASDTPYVAYDVDSAMTYLADSLDTLQVHTETLSGLREKSVYLTPEIGDPTYYNDINDLIRLGSQLENSLGITTNTVLATAASALQSDLIYAQIIEDLNIIIKRGITTIEELTSDAANDVIIVSIANRMYESLNNNYSTLDNIVSDDIAAAQAYDSRVSAVDKITKATSMVNTDGFSKLKGLVVKPEYMDLITYK